jgi:diaminopimelate epimerase
MRLRFTKMHGAGNDFVMLNAVDQPLDLSPAQFRAIADRHFGVGADQILIVERPTISGADFRYRIINADGGEVEQCGNGARCFVRFVHHVGLSAKPALRVQTAMGMIEPQLQPDGRVRVDMGPPVFDLAHVPFVASGLETRGGARKARQWQLPLSDGTSPWVSVVSMGNPHLVQIVEDCDRAPVRTQGPLLEHHFAVPRKANIGYLQIVDRSRVRLRVWERGVGETLACGTGACAAVVAGIGLGVLDGAVEVETRGGALLIEWAGEWVGERVEASDVQDHAVFMTGPAEFVFDGEVDLAALHGATTMDDGKNTNHDDSSN